MKRSNLIQTNPGDIQEEAPSTSVPVLALSETTERSEGAKAVVVLAIGAQLHRIVGEAKQLLETPSVLTATATGVNPYGDGNAVTRTVLALMGLTYKLYDSLGLI